MYQASTCLISGSESTTIEPTTGGPSGGTVTTAYSTTTSTDTNKTNALLIGGVVAAAVIVILGIVVAVYCVYKTRMKTNKANDRGTDGSRLKDISRKETPSGKEMAAAESLGTKTGTSGI